MKLGNREILFCDIHPVCYAISEQKEILRRHLKNRRSDILYAQTIQAQPLPVQLSLRSNKLIKQGKGIDPVLQHNKVVNINLAARGIHGVLIRPGEVFSFWERVGKVTRNRGYKDGRVIMRNKLRSSIGGGLCNLANTIHWLVLHSPLDVIEFHSHSDALDPDRGERVLLNSGTSVSYNYIDYRFQNNTDQTFQLRVWCDEEQLHGQLLCERPIPHRFQLTEEDHHFHQEQEKYYRRSKIYKNTLDKETGALIDKKLVWDNRSEVLYDYSLIPRELIR